MTHLRIFWFFVCVVISALAYGLARVWKGKK